MGSQQRLSEATYKIGYREMRKDSWVMSLAASDMWVRERGEKGFLRRQSKR